MSIGRWRSLHFANLIDQGQVGESTGPEAIAVLIATIATHNDSLWNLWSGKT